MSTLLESNKPAKALKNLGWLLRNWKRVQSLGFNYAPDHKRMIDGELIARLTHGGVYMSEFASASVLWRWLDRPVFRGLKFNLKRIHDPHDAGREFTIGDDDWREITRLEHTCFQAFLVHDFTKLPNNSFYRPG